MKFDCINIHFTDFCNFHCKHCFVKKERKELSLDNIKIVVDKIDSYFKSNNIKGRINLAGGEPLLSQNINEIIDYIYSKGISISIITNGYFLTERFISRNQNKVSCIGISIDSLNRETNFAIGRCQNFNTLDIDQLKNNCKLIKSFGIKLKINTCISKLNVDENFVDFLEEIKPDRYKVFEMICNDKKELLSLKTSKEKINSFLNRHKKFISIFESSKEMKDSYLIIDSSGNLSTNNLHQSNLSILDNDINTLIKEVNINYLNYCKRYS